MQKQCVPLIALLCALIFPVKAFAADPDAKADFVINTLLRDLALFEVLREIPQTISDGLVQRQSEASAQPKSYWDNLERVVRENFSEAALAKSIRDELKRDFDDARYSTLQRLVQSPIGKQLSEKKRGAYTAQAIEAIRALAAEQPAKGKNPARMSLYSQLDDASADTEFFIAAQALAIQALVQLVDNSQQPMSPERRDALMSATYSQLYKPSKFTTTMTYIYAFEQQSNDDLQQYISFYRFGDMQWFLGRAMDALTNAVEQATMEARSTLDELNAAK